MKQQDFFLIEPMLAWLMGYPPIQEGGNVQITGGPVGDIAAKGDITITGYTTVANVI